MRALCFLPLTLVLVSSAALAEPGFAVPPHEPLVLEEIGVGSRYALSAPPSSVVRLAVGPTLRLAPDAADGGLWVAVDVGRGASGFRASGAWVHAGSERGMSAYTAELWIDFGVGGELHPVIGAGAGVARVNPLNADSPTSTVGIGTLRGSLEYVLPVAGADARAGLDLIGNVPAIRGSGAEDVDAWLLGVARVGVGF